MGLFWYVSVSDECSDGSLFGRGRVVVASGFRVGGDVCFAFMPYVSVTKKRIY